VGCRGLSLVGSGVWFGGTWGLVGSQECVYGRRTKMSLQGRGDCNKKGFLQKIYWQHCTIYLIS